MRFAQVRDFLAVVDAGSLHAAARRLGISQPAVTKSVRGLEAELSVQLLQRTTRGIVLTPSGRMFLARARVVQSELDKARDELANSERQDSVGIGVGPLAATAIVPEALTLFRKRFPNASVHIMEVIGRVLTDLVRDEVLDLGVTRKPDVKLGRALAFRPLYHNALAVVARKGHPLSDAGSVARLASAEWVSFSLGPAATANGDLEQVFASAGLPLPSRVVRCDAQNTALALLAKTDAVALMPRRLLPDGLASHLLQEIPVAEPLPSFTTGLVTRADTPLTPTAEAMAKALTAVGRDFARRGGGFLTGRR
jgi:LysR family transcriptional regulator of abg operon